MKTQHGVVNKFTLCGASPTACCCYCDCCCCCQCFCLCLWRPCCHYSWCCLQCCVSSLLSAEQIVQLFYFFTSLVPASRLPFKSWRTVYWMIILKWQKGEQEILHVVLWTLLRSSSSRFRKSCSLFRDTLACWINKQMNQWINKNKKTSSKFPCG